jgi:hypothetical protein
MGTYVRTYVCRWAATANATTIRDDALLVRPMDLSGGFGWMTLAS